MKCIEQAFIIFGTTMAGKVLNAILPLPVPSGVYGLFLMLLGLCMKAIKISDVENVGDFPLDTTSIMLTPISVDLIESYGAMKVVLVPLFIIPAISTIVATVVTGKMTELIIRLIRKGGEA